MVDNHHHNERHTNKAKLEEAGDTLNITIPLFYS